MLHVVMQILHAGFFRAAHEHANAVLQGNLVIPEEFHQIQAQDCRGFVVRNAAANEGISHSGGTVGRIDPLVAFGHHVQMAHDADGVIGVAENGGTHVALVIRGVKAHFLCVGQGEIQHLATFGAEGGVFFRLGGLADGTDPGKGLNVGDHGFSIFFQECGNFLTQFVHFLQNSLKKFSGFVLIITLIFAHGKKHAPLVQAGF